MLLLVEFDVEERRENSAWNSGFDISIWFPRMQRRSVRAVNGKSTAGREYCNATCRAQG